MKLDILLGSPGSGKSTYARTQIDNFKFQSYVNQDSQGKEGHFVKFLDAIKSKQTIVLDRMNFNKAQRAKYITPAREAGYLISATIFHTPKAECLRRCSVREKHETIHDVETARTVINFFFKSYEAPTLAEVDVVESIVPASALNHRPSSIICDLDGTLCNINHRLKYVKKEDGKKASWGEFFRAMSGDVPNEWCTSILQQYVGETNIVLCSGRPEEYREPTIEWLDRHCISYDRLFMRPSGDHRQDDIIKETILDFDILPQFTPKFFIDDRTSVVSMWRRRGFVCLQCADGDF